MSTLPFKEGEHVTTYETPKKGFSMFSDQPVEIIGERTIKREDGSKIEQYLYNIEGYTPENGMPFVSLKANIIVEGGK